MDSLRQQVLCRLDDMADGTARGFSVDNGEQALAVIIVRQGSVVYGYRNRCPHTGINLEWLPDQFFDGSGEYLQCSVHGALFRPEDGYCIRGPCAGKSLESWPVSIRGEYIVCVAH